MSINLELKKLQFMLNSGISTFIQNTPNPIYQIKKKQKITKNDLKIKNISDIQTLNELETFIQNSDVCDLKKNAIQTVFADGNPAAKIMLIGEAPGADEDKYGKPFVGLAGQLLDKMLKAIGLDRKKVYISNVIPWRPLGNRQPTSEEILQCLPFIQKHIEIINPLTLILLGGTAAKSLLTTNLGITKLRGFWHQYNSLGLLNPIQTRAIFHPSFLLRSPEFKKITWQDLLEIQKKIKFNENN